MAVQAGPVRRRARGDGTAVAVERRVRARHRRRCEPAAALEHRLLPGPW
uniref:Uncharacterized protein n=1 Tax=Nonomuraea gerenzanensis TaxID=93944 RepID=A0A1M4ED37_9ACTN|nr:hypothetical protein BN4615_P6009 [Nonomuraea gerenzanensis]